MALLDFAKKKKNQIVDAYKNDASTLGIAKNTVKGLGSAFNQVVAKGPAAAYYDANPEAALNVGRATAFRMPEEIAGNLFSGVKDFAQTAGGAIGEGLAYGIDKNVRDQYKAGNLDILPTVSNVSPLQMIGKTARAGLEVATPKFLSGAARAKDIPEAATLVQRLGEYGKRALRAAPAGYAYDLSNKVAEGGRINDSSTYKPGMGTAMSMVFGAGTKPSIDASKTFAKEVADSPSGQFVSKVNEVLPQIPGAARNSFSNRQPGAIRKERIPSHYIPSRRVPVSEQDGKPGVFPELPKDSRFTGRVRNDGIDPVTLATRFSVKTERMLPEQIVERGRRKPTLSDLGREVVDALPRPGMNIQAIDDPLLQEARKYKTAEEFRKAMNQSHLMDLSNQELHRWGRAIPSYADEPYTDIGQIIQDANRPGSYLSTMKYSNPVEYRAVSSPKDTITIYRAVPENAGDEIRIGDYVALDKRYAQMHLESVLEGEQGVNGKIISKTVPKKDVIWGNADFTEWAYSPKDLRDKYPSLTDLWNKSHGSPKTLKDLGKELVDALPRPGMSIQYVSGGRATPPLPGKIDEIVKAEADAMIDMYRSAEGVKMLNTGYDYLPGSGEFNRVSSNPRWYRDFFKENGRAPSKKEILAMAKDALEKGRGYLQDEFDKAKNPTPDDVNESLLSFGRRQPTKAEVFQQPPRIFKNREYPKPLHPDGTLPTEQRGFISSVKNSENITPEVKEGVYGVYSKQTNKQSFGEAKEAIYGGFEDAVHRAKTDQAISRKGNAEALDLIGRLQSSGRTQDAIDIVENLARKGTEAGQSIQLLSAINRLTPEGVLMWAQRNIEKAKVENPERFGSLRMTPEKASILRKKAEDAQRMAGDEKMRATLDLVDEIQKIVPSSWAQKLTTLWKAGLLTGIKGAVGGSSIGNTTNVIMRKLADVPAAAVDSVLAQITGNRSKVFTLSGLFSGAKEGTKEAVKNMRMGTGANDLGYKMDYKKVYFDTPAVQKYVDSVFNFYSAADRPFYHSALQNSLYDLAAVAGKNQGLKGKALNEFVDKTVKNPGDTILNRAIEEAKSAVFQDKTAIGSGLSGLKQGLKKHGGAAGEIVSEAVAPFTGVPSSIANAVHRYSPTGAAQGIYKALVASNSGNFDQMAQRNLSEAIGKGITGTGVIWLGMQLTNSGQMTLGYPTDPGERSLWEREGKMPYSIKIGGKWRSLNYTGNVMSLLAIGGEIKKAMGEGGSSISAIGQGVLGSGKAILSSSPLQGAQAGMNALTDPQRYGDSYFRNLASSTVPTLTKDFASAGDRVSREVNTVGDAFKNKIPGMRNSLLPKRDVFGEIIENPSGPVSSIIDPLRSREEKSDPITDELRRLQDADFGPTLSMPDETIKAFGEEVKMTPEELDAFEEKTGSLSKEAVSRLINSPQYKSLGDEQKKDLIDKTINDIRRAEKERIISGSALPNDKNGQIDNVSVKPSKAQKDLAIYNFMNSDDDSMEFDGKYYIKDDSSASGYRSKTVEARGVDQSKEKMQSYKNDKDVDSWLKEADVLYKKYDKMLRAETDEVERLKIENDMKTLAEQFNKYKSYGGYTKPKKANKVKVPSINDADFIVKKMTSRLRPLRAFGRSRTSLASVARPNIRRPKRLS